MGVREHASGTSSGWRYDDDQNDRIILSIYGPKGATKFCGVLSTIEARTLRDQLELAMTRINDVYARAENEAAANGGSTC
ncbi:hypothetical protein [Bradyrhizobium sp. SZCCHNRI2010]|uniref:hypothetical protein n=1 Tax=Bradyrhizobium sp. SZCCHNRI2010 TaxID=3057283 RepID=UPI0028EF032E|nr:hypothetical protein [Bradyrhizobium sp. SZCCHNRI2010]